MGRRWHTASCPEFEDFDLGLINTTHFESFRVLVPWVEFEDRAGLVPGDFDAPDPWRGDPSFSQPDAIPGSTLDSEPIDFNQFLDSEAGLRRLASISGPQTLETGGWLPASQPLPFTVNFRNTRDASRYVNEVHIVSELDHNLDPATFELGDIRLGDISVDLGSGRSRFQRDIDFTRSHGFILRVSAGIDALANTASWVLQAIDPLTGEKLDDPQRGLLSPHDGLGRGTGFVSYSIEPMADVATNTLIQADARVLFDTLAPEDTPTIQFNIDGSAPTTDLQVAAIGANDFQVDWDAHDEAFGSRVRHVTLYVATDGGDFKIWKRQLTDASGTLVFEGEQGRTYEFLALATDVAGNREPVGPGVIAPPDGAPPNLGPTSDVDPSVPNLGTPPEPSVTPSTNPLFVSASAGIPNIRLTARPSDFTNVITPFVDSSFATGFPESHGDIGPMALVELPDGSFLVSGGTNRSNLYLFDPVGGVIDTPWAQLNDPIFNLAIDGDGHLWATTGGGALLKLDGQSGQVLGRFGVGLTIALAIEPETGLIYVSSNYGVEVFDPATETFSRFSRDENLRVGSLAFAPDGALWAATWPDRSQVVRFTERGRAEAMLRFDTPIDSIAFGVPGTALDDLLFVSHNAGRSGQQVSGSELTMVDLATLQRVAVANGGSRGDVLLTTSTGKLLISQSEQVDLIQPALAPVVVATNPPTEASVALPFPLITVTFDQDMLVGDSDDPAGVTFAGNYALVGEVNGQAPIHTVVYDAQTRTALLSVGPLTTDHYTLTVRAGVRSQLGEPLINDYTTSFAAVGDLSSVVEITFGTARSDRATGTVSYDVTLTNIGIDTLVLPVLLVLDPAAGYQGVPDGAEQDPDGGRWLINLSDQLPPDGQLQPGESTTGRTITIINPDDQRVVFDPSVLAQPLPNVAPVFESTPLLDVTVGQAWVYTAQAVDAEGQSIVYWLYDGPDGMSLDPGTGLATWTPTGDADALTPVTIQAYDVRGAVTTQRFEIAVAGGNHPPMFTGVPTQIDAFEGETIMFEAIPSDADADDLVVWADGLPPGAAFDPATGRLTWTPGFEDAGTYPDVRFLATDGRVQTIAATTIVVQDRDAPVSLLPIPDRTVREGDRISFLVRAESGPGQAIEYTSPLLPPGATLDPVTGLFDWTPGFDQRGTVPITFEATSGDAFDTTVATLTVLNVNAPPVFVQQENWRIYEGQTLLIQTEAFDPDSPGAIPGIRLDDGRLFLLNGIEPTVSYQAQNLPPAATFDPDTAELIWTTDFDDAGLYEVTITATDTGDGLAPESATLVIPIEVLPFDRSPVIDPILNLVVQRDAVGQLVVSATDPDGDPVTLNAANALPGFPLPDFVRFVDQGDGSGVFTFEPIAGDRGGLHPGADR